MKDQIYERLSQWSNEITTKYPGLKVRFEYSTVRHVFLVSLYPDEVTADKDIFNLDIMAFEDEMENIYGMSAPLFCDNEELFALSAEAETIFSMTENQGTHLWEFTFDDIFSNSDNSLAA